MNEKKFKDLFELSSQKYECCKLDLHFLLRKRNCQNGCFLCQIKHEFLIHSSFYEMNFFQVASKYSNYNLLNFSLWPFQNFSFCNTMKGLRQSFLQSAIGSNFTIKHVIVNCNNKM